MENLLTIEAATNSIAKNSTNKPSPDSVISALIEIEKQSKKEQKKYQLEQLSGNWQLCFVTGTKKTREKVGIILGAGRYIPNWVKITLSYSSPRSNKFFLNQKVGKKCLLGYIFSKKFIFTFFAASNISRIEFDTK